MAIRDLPHDTQMEQEMRLKMSFEAFMRWAEGKHAEWVDGEVIVFMTAKESHQVVLNFLNHLMDMFAAMLNLGKVRIAPYAMRAEPQGSVREPDILFVSQENASRLTESMLEGPADLIVELISDESVRRDRDEKFREYRRAGVREYWIIDPRPGRQRADFFRLDAEGQYELYATEDDERVESQVIAGFWLRPFWLWQVDELDPLMTFLEIRGVPPEQAQQIRQTLQQPSAKDA